jgi:hypothetical protein
MPSPEEMTAAMVRNMQEKTGKSLPAWLQIARKAVAQGHVKHGQLVKHLKGEHGMPHGFANLVASETLKPAAGAPAGDDLVAAQYAGPKAGLVPIYDALVKAVRTFGKDVELAPKKANVSLRRSKQFALIQPSTRTRVDVGLELPGRPPKGRLEASGSFSEMVTHRVRVADVSEVDAELVGWLRAAYDEA